MFLCFFFLFLSDHTNTKTNTNRQKERLLINFLCRESAATAATVLIKVAWFVNKLFRIWLVNKEDFWFWISFWSDSFNFRKFFNHSFKDRLSASETCELNIKILKETFDQKITVKVRFQPSFWLQREDEEFFRFFKQKYWLKYWET